MHRNRFTAILKNLHFADNTKVDKKDTRTKLLPLLDCVLKKYDVNNSVPEYPSVDESMVGLPYYGRNHTKQFIRRKPIRFGFKMWTHCSKQGYQHSFEFYTGRHDDSDPMVDNLGVGGNVVIKLVKATNLAKDSGCKVFFDNYFTSVPLLKKSQSVVSVDRDLQRKQTAKCPLISQNEMKDKQRGTTDYATYDENLIKK